MATLHGMVCWWCGHWAEKHVGMTGPCGDCWAEGRTEYGLYRMRRGSTLDWTKHEFERGQRHICEGFVLAREDVARVEAAMAVLEVMGQ